jgi:hypothetical protein
MLRRFFVLPTVLLLVAAPVLAQDRADALLVLADDGALDASAVHAIRNLAASELRKRGIALSEDRRSEGLRPIDSSVSTLAVELGARRVFALRIGGRLGQKIPLSLDELTASSLAPVYSASMTALGLDECDVVTARLVQAVVDRRSPESTAEMKTVTAAESRPFAKKPGERFWFIGLPIALYNGGTGTSPFGFTVGYGYEAENFRVNATAGGFGRGGDGVGYLVLEASWIPLQGELSPYLGGGIGYMGASHAGMGGAVEGGVEAFRLHGVRGLAGVQFLIPFFDNAHDSYDPASGTTRHVSGRAFYPAAFVRLAF